MGYNLIGYILVGEKELHPYEKEAVEQATKVMSLVESASDKFTDDELTQALSEEEKNYFSAAFSDIDIDIYPEMLKEKLDFLFEQVTKPDSFVKEFIDFWKYPDNRDTNYRFHQGRQIVFAGAESHGEEPDGVGYTLIKTAEMLGLLPVFNID